VACCAEQGLVHLAAAGRCGQWLGGRRRAGLDAVAAGHVAAGRLAVPVVRTYALADVPAAFGEFAAGTLGKLAITVDMRQDRGDLPAHRTRRPGRAEALG
jgi:hypothetical protein